ncbi:hypothetical protein A374_02624 [Fictibacillus macauensis ZFHKF-1]|uniref:VOC domain-containing protein n=1 Tax=Fictibacillus macauensis ZFHKF-1 TaxID=1196324 RepID=I8AMC0_9BACL|nr:VOC family protein [Fictibacillus macauensis]EIT87112.1 hypothetical protein A374_02624 [Fictibacillus macauensis ZFHKF-1]
MKLFHYHFWTDKVEETEQFYRKLGFTVIGRHAMGKGTIVTYHPPLDWNDFREESPLFRIIEVGNGEVRITFGAGKASLFDHIGFLVNADELHKLCNRAEVLGWKVARGERRTFIHTPYRFKLELQLRHDLVQETDIALRAVTLEVNDDEVEQQLRRLFNGELPAVNITKGERVHLKEVHFQGLSVQENDPNGVKLKGEEAE